MIVFERDLGRQTKLRDKQFYADALKETLRNCGNKVKGELRNRGIKANITAKT